MALGFGLFFSTGPKNEEGLAILLGMVSAFLDPRGGRRALRRSSSRMKEGFGLTLTTARGGRKRVLVTCESREATTTIMGRAGPGKARQWMI